MKYHEKYGIILEHDDEQFRPITYPIIKQGKYLISNYGRIYSIDRDIIMKNKLAEDGYYHINLSRAKKNGGYNKIFIGVHKLVCYAFCDGYDESLGRIIPNHKDLNPKNNYYKNLEWTTYSENTKHYIENTDTLKNRHDYSEFWERCNVDDMFYFRYDKNWSYGDLSDLYKIPVKAIKFMMCDSPRSEVMRLW